MRKGVLVASRGSAWVAVWATVAVLLVWFAVPVSIVVREWDDLCDLFKTDLWTVLTRYLLFAGAFLTFGIFHFLPLYCADAFLRFGVRNILQAEERRRVRLAVCVLGMAVSAGVVAWYAREAVLLEIREFFV